MHGHMDGHMRKHMKHICPCIEEVILSRIYILTKHVYNHVFSGLANLLNILQSLVSS